MAGKAKAEQAEKEAEQAPEQAAAFDWQAHIEEAEAKQRSFADEGAAKQAEQAGE